jgi:hypothetical protein
MLIKMICPRSNAVDDRKATMGTPARDGKSLHSTGQHTHIAIYSKTVPRGAKYGWANDGLTLNGGRPQGFGWEMPIHVQKSPQGNNKVILRQSCGWTVR